MEVGDLVKLYDDRDPSKFWLGLVVEIIGWNCGVIWADDGGWTWEEIDDLVEVKI